MISIVGDFEEAEHCVIKESVLKIVIAGEINCRVSVQFAMIGRGSDFYPFPIYPVS
jgi:hypothetical protein